MYRLTKFHSKKMLKRRRKLRSLVSEKIADVERSSLLQNVGFLVFAICTLSMIAVGLQSMSWTSFLVTYRDQYNLLVYGQKDYCKPVMDTQSLFSEVNEHVLNQADALRTIEMQLRNDSRFTAIAVVGRTGVGKSLFANALHDHFPWQENIRMFSWRMFDISSNKEAIVQSALRYLSDCGQNLIVIDNLVPEDLTFIQKYTNLSMKNVENSNANLIVLYVINVATYTEEQREIYDANMNRIRELENVKIVEFRKFGTNELRDCILHEARNLNYTLDGNSLGEVIKLIDVERSGCKNVHPKVLMYGQLAQ